MEVGSKVICNANAIDKQTGKGSTGTVTGFARLSSYHPREVMVKLSETESRWFWERDVTPV